MTRSIRRRGRDGRRRQKQKGGNPAELLGLFAPAVNQFAQAMHTVHQSRKSRKSQFKPVPNDNTTNKTELTSKLFKLYEENRDYINEFFREDITPGKPPRKDDFVKKRNLLSRLYDKTSSRLSGCREGKTALLTLKCKHLAFIRGLLKRMSAIIWSDQTLDNELWDNQNIIRSNVPYKWFLQNGYNAFNFPIKVFSHLAPSWQCYF